MDKLHQSIRHKLPPKKRDCREKNNIFYPKCIKLFGKIQSFPDISNGIFRLNFIASIMLIQLLFKETIHQKKKQHSNMPVYAFFR